MRRNKASPRRQPRSQAARTRSPINSPSHNRSNRSLSAIGSFTMAGKNTAAFGIYTSETAAETAVDRLTAAGFSNQDVSVLMSDKQGSKDFAAEKNTKAPEGAATGVGVGGAIGGTLGLLAGIGALAIPGVGPLIAAGPIMAALAGLGVGGVVGGLLGALVGMGIPEYEAKRYEGAVKGGGTLLSVHCDTSDQIDVAKSAMKDTGAHDISSSSEAASSKTDGGRETFGNISEGNRLSSEPLDREPISSNRDVVKEIPVTTRR